MKAISPVTDISESVMVPDWPAPGNVQALMTTRKGGVSSTPYDSLNLGFHVSDSQSAVKNNWLQLIDYTGLATEPVLLDQVHGNRVIQLPVASAGPYQADGAFTRLANQPCTILTADCLPVLLCDTSGTQVAALHAGWRGLAANVIGKGVECFDNPNEVLAYLGPAICSRCFEVGGEVREAFLRASASWGESGVDLQLIESCFKQCESRWLADLYQLARYCLNVHGVTAVYGGEFCTVEQNELFYSYRRDGVTGRMASVIWLS